jgi:uncharacterized protein (DUF1015 family)
VPLSALAASQPLRYTDLVVEVSPFTGLLYDPARVGHLTAVTSPPYDVILPHEQDRLHRSSPYNVALVDLGADVGGDPFDKYMQASRLLRRWRSDRILVPTPGPSLYPYEMRFTYRGAAHRVRGVFLQVGLEPWGAGVLPHERTIAAPVEDRLRLVRATRADLSPIYAVVPGPSEAQSALLERTDHAPDRELVDEEGVVHRLWVGPPDEDLVAWYRAQVLLVADGHHRYQTALAHQEEMHPAHGPGPWDQVMMLVVDAATEEPPILPIHRLLRVDRLPEIPADRVHDLGEILYELADDDLRFGAVFREDGAVVHAVGRLPGEPPTVRALHHSLLDPMPGVRELRFTPDAAGAEGAVRSGRADLALLLPPARVEHVRTVVERGDRLPQKSTYFWPKPRTGLVIRPFD